MGRTTSPPQLDITSVFSELAPLAREAVRLHPRTGAPAVTDSSLGGPLLWPAEQPWPACQEPHERSERILVPPELTSLDQAFRWARTSGMNGGVQRQGDGRIYAKRWYYQPPQAPSPLVGVLQLHARDVPELPSLNAPTCSSSCGAQTSTKRPGTDHAPATVWRRAAEATGPLAAPPAPRFDEELFGPDYLPLPCVLHPERVVEYPYAEDPGFSDLTGRLDQQVRQWQQRHDSLYWAELSTAPGTKVGGWPRWIQEPQWPQCHCGRRMDHLLTIASGEFGARRRWLPLEDRDDPTITAPRPIADPFRWPPHGIMLGDGGSLYLFTCTSCAERPLAGTMQCT